MSAMFSQVFVSDKRDGKKPYSMAASLLLQLIAISLLVLVQLIYHQVLPEAQLKSLVTAPLPPRGSSPKTTQPSNTRVTTAVKQPRPFFFPDKQKVTAVVRVSENASIGAPVGVPGGDPDTNVLAAATGPDVQMPIAPAPPLRVRDSATKAPIRVGTISEANLLHKVQPIYPPLAKVSRIQGVVEFTATISKEGQIENLQLVRGHPLLINAAREAVLQWRYKPTMLNDQPVEVITDILVNFTLTQ